MVDLNKKLQMCLLSDFYGNLLTDKQKEIFSRYWEQDLSLFEIAERLGITRQAVHDSLNKAEQLLVKTEEKCGFAARHAENKKNLQQIIDSLDSSDPKQKEISKKLQNLLKKL